MFGQTPRSTAPHRANELSANARYEVKLLVQEGNFSDVLLWLHADAGAHPSYPPRFVNSIYLDTPDLRHAQDNLWAVTPRTKVRVRWYEDQATLSTSAAVIESKRRVDRYVEKRQWPCSFSGRIAELSQKTVVRGATECLKAHREATLLADVSTSTVHVRYLRHYYQLPNAIRVTLDRELVFRNVASGLSVKRAPLSSVKRSVLELKGAPAAARAISACVASLPLTTTRHSKYLVGLSLFGLAPDY